jgi:hypothetical protein
MATTTDRNRTDGLLGRLEVADLVHRLAACLDEHRFADLPNLFTKDVVAVTPGGTVADREALVAQAVRNHADYRRLQHRMSNVLVELDGERGTVRADLVARFLQDGDAPVLSLGAVYRFDVLLTDEGWRFNRMEVSQVWRSEHS